MESEDKSVDANSFLDRQKNLNAQLEAIEKSLNKHNNHTDSRVPRLEDLSSDSPYRNKIKGYRGRQSIFKRPEMPAPRSKISVIPDYRINPEKWTCYSMDNVTDMSNESNSQAAFAFLRELEQRREKNKRRIEVRDKRKMTDDDMDVDSAEGDGCSAVVSFKKPSRKKETVGKPKVEFKSNKIVMPEYEFGTKRVTKKKNLQKPVTGKIDKSKEIKLDHLAYDDGDDE